MPAKARIASALIIWLGSLVFVAFGLFVGYLLPSDNAMQVVGPLMALLAFLGGMFIPLTPGSTMDRIGSLTPMYGLHNLALWPMGAENFSWWWVVNVLTWLAIFLGGAAWRMGRDTSVLTSAGIRADLPLTVEAVAPELRELFAWVVREGVTNIVRHAHASLCKVKLATDSIELADDQAMVRGALAALLALETDIEVVAQVGNGDDVLPVALEHRPDVVLMDVDMPGTDGLHATASLLERLSATRVLIVTTFGRPGFLRRAIQSGAHGFVVKEAPATELSESVRRVHAGLRVVDPALAADSLIFGDSPLTARETEVLQAATDGATVSEVARRVHLSEGTTRNHLSQAMAKTGAPTRAAAVHIAAQKGWIIE